MPSPHGWFEGMGGRSQYDGWYYEKTLCDFEELEIELVSPAYQHISPLALCGGFSSSGALYLRYSCLSDGS